MEPQPHLERSLDLVVEPAVVGEQIEMVEHGRRPAERQFGEADLSGHPDVVRRHPCPDGIQRAQPIEQAGVLRPGDGPGQGLIQMVMRVDQTGQHDVAPGVEHLVGQGGQVRRRSDRNDEAVLGVQTAACDLAPSPVHRDQDVGVADEERAHVVATSRRRGRA